MQDELFTVEHVAAMCNLHPKTIRRFIKEGKLLARKVGGQWRLPKQDVAQFMGHAVSSPADVAQQERISQEGIKGNAVAKIQVSAVVDVLVPHVDEALRLSNTIFAVLNCKDQAYGETRCDYLFYPNELKARFILWGQPRFISQMVGLIAEIAEQKKERPT
jgi:excisionase family DNA binding protein